MKIAFFSPAWPYGSNGIVSYVRNISEALHNLGHDVFILTFSATGTIGFENLIVMPTEPKTSLLRRFLQKIFPQPKSPEKNHESVARIIANQLIELHKQRQIDIFEIEETFGWCGLIAKLVPLPVIVRLHGPYAYYGKWDSVFDHLRATTEGNAIRQAAAITSPSYEVLTATRDYYQLGDVGSVIPNPVPVPPREIIWSPDSHTPETLLFVGRTDSHKGGDLVLKVFNKLVEIFPNLTLHFVGPDKGFIDAPVGTSWADYLLANISSTARQRIVYHGTLSPSEISALRRKCAITLAFSRYENFPLTCLEAIAYGAPLVATRVGGIPEIVIQGETGLLADPDNLDNLTATVKSLLDNPQLAIKLGAGARDFCEKTFHPTIVAQHSLDVYQTAIQNFNRG
jgi:glycosyltransferase involved in cell wall biosynthesis